MRESSRGAGEGTTEDHILSRNAQMLRQRKRQQFLDQVETLNATIADMVTTIHDVVIPILNSLNRKVEGLTLTEEREVPVASLRRSGSRQSIPAKQQQQFAKMLLRQETTRVELGRRLNVGERTLRRWCDNYSRKLKNQK